MMRGAAETAGASMVARVGTIAFQGIEGVPVDVQVMVAPGKVGMQIVGLPDKAVAESRERVQAALHASGLTLPPKKVTVNLAPADLPKEGSHYDLPIALALMAVLGAIPADALSGYVVIGELNLDGTIAPVAGALPAAISANAMGRGLICPYESGPEAAWAGSGIDILAPRSLIALANHFRGTQVLGRPEPAIRAVPANLPDLADINFAQDGREVSCAPGGFVLERGDAPYEFSHPGANLLWVFKVPAAALRARVGPPERLSAMSFDATKGVGAYFVDAVRTSARRIAEMNSAAHEVVGQHLIDLLCLAIQGDERVLSSNLSSVRSAHLFRAEQFIRGQLSKQELLPQDIADACGISLRYLQRLFTDSGRSICEWIREQRLLMCDEELRKKNSQLTISEIAYNWGFSDQSQFSKHYRAYFSRSPSEARLQYRQQTFC